MWGRLALIAVAAALALPAAAQAQEGPPSPNWGLALPGGSVPADVQPHGVEHCRRASMRCLDGLIRRLRAQWAQLDAACDHRAVASLAYLRISEELRRLIRAGGLRYEGWMHYVIAHFSNHYFRFFGEYARGRPVPHSWKVAYDQATRGDASAGQDTLLFSNAHVQRDLPHVYAEMGMATRRGVSRKPDHDAVNVVNDRIFAGLEDEIAERYDPMFSLIRMTPAGLERIGTLQLVQTWREGAWRNGERLMNARTDEERERSSAQIEANANAWADFIGGGGMPGYRATRDAHCAASAAA
jgi:hypothetical protein